jgi:hypothetical protein
VGVVLASAAAAPFLETLIYIAHVGAGRRVLSALEYVVLALFSVLLWLLMAISFLVDPKGARVLLQRFQTVLSEARLFIRRRALIALFLMPLALGILVFAGAEVAQLLYWFSAFQAVLLPFLQILTVTVLIWFIASLIRAIADLRQDLIAAIGSWAFCLRVSIGFYAVLILAILLVFRTNGIKPEARLEFRLAIAKDCCLLFIIAGMLYLGLFRLALARRLTAVFNSIKGFVQFLVLCALIAILAIWADFGSMSPSKHAVSFYETWQRDYNIIHVYLRDIGLLLMPIAGLLYWTLKKVANELKENSVEK